MADGVEDRKRVHGGIDGQLHAVGGGGAGEGEGLVGVQPELVLRVALLQLEGGPGGYDLAVVQDDDLVCCGGLLHVVGGEEHGHIFLGAEGLDDLPNVLAGGGIQTGGGFVEE